MSVKIAIISANKHKMPYPVYPLGTAYLKSYLQSHISDCIVDILDMNMISDINLEHYLRDNKHDYICVSLRNVDGANSLDRRGFLVDYKFIINIVRKSTNAPIIIGGSGFSIFPEVFMSELDVDYGIKGEGEGALCELILAISENRTVGSISNLYRNEKNNNSAPTYIESTHAIYEPELVEYYWNESGMLNIQTKRGCPYDCIYCTYPQIDGRCVRTIDIDSIIETIGKAKHDFGVTYWFFTDSVFNINSDFNVEFAEILVKKNLKISWGAYFSPSNISNEQMSLYKRSGLTHIEFGTESFCDETLNAYGKHFTFDEVLRVSELSIKNDVFYSHFLILAGWGETSQQLAITIENSKHLRHTVIFPYIGMRIYPNTRLHQLAIAEHIISKNDDLIVPKYYITKGFDIEQTRHLALETKKAWVFPDTSQDEMMGILRHKYNMKGPLWEYLRKA